jgi:glycerol-3-phosphate dehydrogenase
VRAERIAALKSGETFDLLVIGGGATGCGIAVDAATRGLKVALVERQDFAEGTSSRSTKLLHGGVRYLEAAIKGLDRAHFHLVMEALAERGRVLANAPHLSRRLAMVTPLYSWLAVPYVWAGLKLYDLLSGRMSLGASRLLSRAETLRLMPGLRGEGLKAGVLYYDGQFVDSRLVIALMRTAREAGAALANYVEAVAILHEDGRAAGARLRDVLTGDSWDLAAKTVINATGPFADRVSRLDDAAAAPILRVSAGVHIVVDRRFLPGEAGLLIPKTDDGRVLFVLPWQGHALIGTTDDPAELADHPKVREADVDYLLDHARRYLAAGIASADVKSLWSGIRPLAFERKSASLAQLARDHVLVPSPSGLLSVSGGKWTTYRLMAEQAVDRVTDLPCRTRALTLFGARAFAPDGAGLLRQEDDVAEHLHFTYGDQASRVLAAGKADRLHPNHPYIVAEVIHAVREEDAEHAIDVLARRLTLAMVDRRAAAECGDQVIALMASELEWDEERQQAERELLSRRLSEAL